MSRFKKFIESEMPNKNHKKREKKGNVFKRRRKGSKRIYKSKVSREEFLNNMKAKGATINSYSIIDAINAKNKKQNNYDKKNETKVEQQKSKPVKNEIVEEYDNYNEEEKQAMKNLVLLQYYEQQIEEDEEEINTENILAEKKDDFISF